MICECKAWAMHYNSEHPGITPDLSFHILLIEPQTVRRKIFEAMYINDFKPTLNLKEEFENSKTMHTELISGSTARPLRRYHTRTKRVIEPYSMVITSLRQKAFDVAATRTI